LKPYYKTDRCALYQCDNLELMKSLPENYINLIYCDILYGTGKTFKDYQDLKAERSIIEEFYYPRFKEMFRILKDNGYIYIQMDSKISHWVRIILDETFGYENFNNEIIWHYTKMNATNNKFISNHDNIFSYCKTSNHLFNIQYTNNESALRTRLDKFIVNDIIYWKSIKNHKSQLMNSYIKSAKNRLDKIELEDDDVVIDFSNKNKQKMDDVWDIPIIKGNSKENWEYDTQKPRELLRRIINSSSTKNDVIADFFMGSGSSGEVALELNRKFIGCDIGDRACKISQERLEN
jgi:DNA modification methylase